MPRARKVIPTTEGFDGTLRLVFDPTVEHKVRASVAARDGLCNPFGLIHGGVYASIAESIATASTIYRVYQDGNAAIGLSNETRLMRPISEGSVHAVARVRHSGRTTWVRDVEFFDDAERLCALSRLTVAIQPYSSAAV